MCELLIVVVKYLPTEISPSDKIRPRYIPIGCATFIPPTSPQSSQPHHVSYKQLFLLTIWLAERPEDVLRRSQDPHNTMLPRIPVNVFLKAWLFALEQEKWAPA